MALWLRWMHVHKWEPNSGQKFAHVLDLNRSITKLSTLYSMFRMQRRTIGQLLNCITHTQWGAWVIAEIGCFSGYANVNAMSSCLCCFFQFNLNLAKPIQHQFCTSFINIPPLSSAWCKHTLYTLCTHKYTRVQATDSFVWLKRTGRFVVVVANFARKVLVMKRFWYISHTAFVQID